MDVVVQDVKGYGFVELIYLVCSVLNFMDSRLVVSDALSCEFCGIGSLNSFEQVWKM